MSLVKPIYVKLNNKTYGYNETRISKFINSSNKEEALYMGVLDHILDSIRGYFGLETKKQKITLLYNYIQGEVADSLKAENRNIHHKVHFLLAIQKILDNPNFNPFVIAIKKNPEASFQVQFFIKIGGVLRYFLDEEVTNLTIVNQYITNFYNSNYNRFNTDPSMVSYFHPNHYLSSFMNDGYFRSNERCEPIIIDGEFQDVHF